MHSNPCVLVSAASITLAIMAGPAAAQCGAFTVTKVPTGSNWQSGMLEDVDEVAPSDVWAVGSYDVQNSPYTHVTYSLAMHWNGTAWAKTNTVSPAPYFNGTDVELHAVGAAGANDVWAAGERNDQAGGVTGHGADLQHWNGTSWSEVPLPVPAGGAGYQFKGSRIWDIAVLAANDVWFGGAWVEQSGTRPLAMHWDGTSLTIASTPPISGQGSGFAIRSLSALAPNDIWAACVPNSLFPSTTQNVVLHYDGSSWAQVSVPSAASSHELYSAVALAPDDVWVLGQNTYPTKPYALHFDGSTWSEVGGAPLAWSASAGQAGDLYASYDDIVEFDGQSTRVVSTFEAFNSLELLSVHGSSSCSMWVVGQFRGAGGYYVPFAAHSAVSPWQTLSGGIATSLGVEPSLTGAGTTTGGQPITLTLNNALPSTGQVLVVGADAQNQSLLGGTLVPSPDLVLGGFTTNAAGTFVLNTAWPLGTPPGTQLWFQMWMLDPAAPNGVAASNGLVATGL